MNCSSCSFCMQRWQEETSCLELKLHSSLSQKLYTFSQVQSFMVQKTFETNLEYGARSVLLPPSHVHFWLDIAKCLMFKGRHAKSLAPGWPMTSLLGLGNQSLQCPCMEWYTVSTEQTGETCTRGSNQNKPPRQGGAHVLCLWRDLDLLSGSLPLPRGVRSAERDGWTCVWTHSSIAGHRVRGKEGNKTELLKSFCYLIFKQICGYLPFPE